MSEINDLQMKYCNSCDHVASTCVVSIESKYHFCPYCGGILYKRKKRKKDGRVIPYEFRGGTITLMFNDLRISIYACSKCEMGELLHEQGLKMYDFHKEDICFRVRNTRQLSYKTKILKERFPERYEGGNSHTIEEIKKRYGKELK